MHLLAFFLFTPLVFRAQTNLPANKYGLQVIARLKDYLDTQRVAPHKRLVDVRTVIPSVMLDLKYCEPDNFTKQQLYPKLTTTYLCQDAAKKLAQVQQQLASMNLGLKIFDAYRPYSVTEKMWAIVPDDRYAANPRYGSGHNRGTAVDLTLAWLDTQKEVDMGTGFDHFSDTAHHAFAALPAAVVQHRRLLKNLMEEAGFKALATEWWHYSLPDAASYPLLNLSFKTLQKQQSIARKKN
jgi:zinc D-Ala-D-Ala dipeptidase